MVQGTHDTSDFWHRGSEQHPKSIRFPSYKEMEDALGHHRQNSEKLIREQQQKMGSPYRATVFLSVQLSASISCYPYQSFLVSARPRTYVIAFSHGVEVSYRSSKALGIPIKED